MDKNIVFRDKQGNTSSIRYNGPHGYHTVYPFSKRGGITLESGALTTRLTADGVIGSAIRTGGRTIYFGRDARMTNRLTPF